MHLVKTVCLVLVCILMGEDGLAASTSADQPSCQLAVEMRDGSRVVGQAVDDTLSFHSITLGDTKLPWTGIRTIEYTEDTDTAHLTATNGDALTVQLSDTTLVLQTSFGKTKLPVKLIRSIKVSPAKASVFAPGGSKNGSELRLTITLRDGSRLVGKGLDDTLIFHSTAMGDLKLTWVGIRSIVYADKDADTAQLTAANGDVYEVQLTAPTVRLETSFGKSEVPVKLIRSISASSEGSPDGHLIGWWKLDDGSGTVAKDSSAGPDTHDGTLINGPTWMPAVGQGKTTLRFNGMGQYVSLGDALRGSYTGLSVSSWIRSGVFNSQTIVQRDDWNNPGGIDLCVEGSHAEFGHAAAKVVSNASVSDSRWHHLVGTMAQGENGAAYVYTIYVDGKLDNTATFPAGLTTSSGGWAIGADFNGTFCFQGLIGDVRLYDRALSASEVEAIDAEQSSEKASASTSTFLPPVSSFNGVFRGSTPQGPISDVMN
jgi:hypothetical protein